MRISLAVAGKGGTGKTTLAALLVRVLKVTQGGGILAVDADPNLNLGEMLGVEPGKPLAEIREEGSSPEGSPASGVGRARAVDDEIQRAITEADGFDLITAFDAIHDQPRPLDVLVNIHAMLKEDGLFSMVDIAASSLISDNQDHPMGPFLYTVSLMHCMPVGLVDGGEDHLRPKRWAWRY